MGRAERFLVYSLLAVLLIAVFGRDYSGLAAPATASEPRLAEELGPADALLLNGTKGELTLTNNEGRVSWSNQETSRAWAIGAVNLSSVLPKLLQRDTYTEEMNELESVALEQNAEFEKSFTDLQNEYGDITPDDPKYPEAQQRAQALMAQYKEWQQTTLQIRAKKAAEQLESAYREVIEAVEVVADNQQIDMVYRFIPTSEEFNSDIPENAAEQIRLRTLLRYPDQIDITANVSEELGL